jgi:CheY-like chemotaxis protein
MVQQGAVLLVEDDIDIREVVAEVLTSEGYEVTTAANGREALHYLHAVGRHPCLVLLDLMMPMMSGQELMEVLREEDRLLVLPVVILSATPHDVPGARRVVRKPVSRELLLQLVAAFCSPAAAAASG